MIDKRGETYKGLNAMLQFISEETANKEFDDDDLEWLDDLYAVVDQALNNISDVIHERI
jgi:Na+/phosphate symporter